MIKFVWHNVKHIEVIPADAYVSVHMLYLVQTHKYYDNYYHPLIFIQTVDKYVQDRTFALTAHMFEINRKRLHSFPVMILYVEQYVGDLHGAGIEPFKPKFFSTALPVSNYMSTFTSIFSLEGSTVRAYEIF